MPNTHNEQIKVNAIVVMVVLAAAGPLFAEQSTAAPPSATGFGASRPARSDPYRKLFEPQKAALPRAIDGPRVAQSRVVCGMTIMPADPKNDPSIVLPAKADGIDYRIRAIDPPICNPAR